MNDKERMTQVKRGEAGGLKSIEIFSQKPGEENYWSRRLIGAGGPGCDLVDCRLGASASKKGRENSVKRKRVCNESIPR